MVDDGFTGCAQASSTNAADIRPEVIYTLDELAAAALEAARVGLRPWYEGRWAATTWDGTGKRIVYGTTCHTRVDANLWPRLNLWFSFQPLLAQNVLRRYPPKETSGIRRKKRCTVQGWASFLTP